MWKCDISDVKIQHIYVSLNHLLPILNELQEFKFVDSFPICTILGSRVEHKLFL